MKIFSKKIIIGFLFLISMSMISFAQSPYARTVSRSNCLVPTSPLLSISGLTFNESISWDPKFWNKHYVTVKSDQMGTTNLWGLVE
jgi:hypothetical protein